MPYEINWEKNGVLVRFSGTFDYNENANATIEIYSAPKFEDVKYAIWDLSGISELNMTKDEAVLAAMHDQFASSRLPHIKMALLAQDEPTRQICEAYVARCQSSRMGWEFMVSGSIESIRTWVVS